MSNHILQSKAWEEFKNEYGTPAIRVGKVMYTKHKIPFTNFFAGIRKAGTKCYGYLHTFLSQRFLPGNG